MMPLRASTSAPRTMTPLFRPGLSPSSSNPVMVTSSASTRMSVLAAPPQSEPPEQLGLETAGRRTDSLPAPCKVSGRSTTTFST